jgi:hypothetical protein
MATKRNSGIGPATGRINAKLTRHICLIVEANLHQGQHNVNAKRRFYIDEDTWYILLGEGYDAQGNLVKANANYLNCVPSLPGTTEQCTAAYSLEAGNYVFNGF